MHLLDVNLWLALAFKRHAQHLSAVAWFRAAIGPSVFCRITQAGFLRLASSPAAMQAAAVSNADAWSAYDQFLADPNISFADEPSGIETRWRSYTHIATFSPKIWMWMPTWRPSPSCLDWKS